MITDQNGNAVWSWGQDEPFGDTIPNQDPNGTGNQFVFNLRFGGQYYDQETGTHYNYFRDYDPATGRYLESDPIGLYGGQASTYASVGGNPLNGIDPFGLANMNLFAPGSNLAQQTDLWNPNGYYSISGHGNPSNVADTDGTLLTPSQLAARIVKDPNYHHQPVYLDSCKTGKGKDSFAQQLATLLGVAVTAPTDNVETVVSTRFGQVVDFSETVANGGSYQTYTPALPYNFGVTGHGW